MLKKLEEQEALRENLRGSRRQATPEEQALLSWSPTPEEYTLLGGLYRWQGGFSEWFAENIADRGDTSTTEARRALAASDLGLSERLGRIAVEAGAGFTAELKGGPPSHIGTRQAASGIRPSPQNVVPKV